MSKNILLLILPLMLVLSIGAASSSANSACKDGGKCGMSSGSGTKTCDGLKECCSQGNESKCACCEKCKDGCICDDCTCKCCAGVKASSGGGYVFGVSDRYHRSSNASTKGNCCGSCDCACCAVCKCDDCKCDPCKGDCGTKGKAKHEGAECCGSK